MSLLKALPAPVVEVKPLPLLREGASPQEIFLHLTRSLVPHGDEGAYYGKLLKDEGFRRDFSGNWWKEIGHPPGTFGLSRDENRSTVCFAAHLDTVGHYPQGIIRHFDKEKGLVVTDGKTPLGADDRAGVTVLLYLARAGIPGLYYLFVGEETGCVGSKAACQADYIPATVTKIISFDRRGKTSVITHQGSRRTCSDTFAEAMTKALNQHGFSYTLDENGVYTDSREFVDQIPECTNLSVGYYDQHTDKEAQDVHFLTKLCNACLAIDWESLPAERDPTKKEYKTYRSSFDWNDEGYGYRGGRWGWSGSTSMGGWKKKQEEDAFEAVANLIDTFLDGKPADPALLKSLAALPYKECADYLDLFYEELQREVMRRGLLEDPDPEGVIDGDDFWDRIAKELSDE